MIRVLLVEDHSMVLDGLRRLMETEPGFAVAGVARDVAGALAALETGRFDVAIIDLHLPDGSGLEVARTAGSRDPQVRCVILTARLSAYDLTLARRLKVRGLVMKEDAFAALTRCVRIVASGGISFPSSGRDDAADDAQDAAQDMPLDLLTPRELEIARLTADGLRTREVGALLDISPGTVKIHLSRVYEKLSITSRVELANLLNRLGAE